MVYFGRFVLVLYFDGVIFFFMEVFDWVLLVCGGFALGESRVGDPNDIVRRRCG